MEYSRVARRYSKALFEVALENQQLEAVGKDLSSLLQEYRAVPDFQAFMDSPVIPNSAKQKTFTDIFKNRLKPLTFNFVTLLIRKNREGSLPAVIAHFKQLLDTHRGILRGEVYSVVPLSAEQMATLKAQLDEVTGKNVLLSQHLDESLLGGVVVKIQDMIYDTSLRNQLEALKQSFIET